MSFSDIGDIHVQYLLASVNHFSTCYICYIIQKFKFIYTHHNGSM
jgi:hypothetical protein